MKWGHTSGVCLSPAQGLIAPQKRPPDHSNVGNVAFMECLVWVWFFWSTEDCRHGAVAWAGPDCGFCGSSHGWV